MTGVRREKGIMHIVAFCRRVGETFPTLSLRLILDSVEMVLGACHLLALWAFGLRSLVHLKWNISQLSVVLGHYSPRVFCEA